MSWCSLAEWCPWPMIKQKHMARCDYWANLLSFFSRSTANDSSGSLVCDESETDQLISIAVLAQVCVWRHRSRDINKCAPRRLQGTFVWWTVDFDINQLAAATSCLLNLEHLVATSSADWLTECRDVSTRRNVSVSRHRAEQLRQQQCAVGVIGLVGCRSWWYGDKSLASDNHRSENFVDSTVRVILRLPRDFVASAAVRFAFLSK